MEGFDPKTSFGHDASLRYDAEDTRGDEEQTVAFLARLADGQEALEFAVGTGRIALPDARGRPRGRHRIVTAHGRPDAREAWWG